MVSGKEDIFCFVLYNTKHDCAMERRAMLNSTRNDAEANSFEIYRYWDRAQNFTILNLSIWISVIHGNYSGPGLSG